MRERTVTKEQAEDAIRLLMTYIGEDPTRPGLVGTPDRIVRMWDEIYRGYDPARVPKITTFDNGIDGIVYDNMVVDTGDFYSMCEHHQMPFFGKYWFAYIPNPKGKILGISKIGRVVDYCAARMQIQERLVSDVVTMLSDALGEEYPPLGIALVMEGEHLCYDRETEILTNSGFKYFRDLKDDDLVAQYDNEKDEVSFVKPQEFVRYHYNGKMVRFNSMSFDLMVTPEHRTLYLSDWERYHTNKRYHFANAKDRIGKLTVLPTAAPYEGRELSGKTFGAITFEGTDFCEFMGYYLSEGWSGEVDGQYKIAISQDIRSKGFESIKNLLSKYGFAQVKQSETKYHFTKTNKELGIYLSQFGRSADKFIPAEIKNASIEQRKVFLRAYYLGDGFTHKKHGYSQITTISSRMADDLQELLCLCGISASISERKAGAYDIILHKSKNGEWKKCAKLYQNQIYEEDYDGEVYCVNVPTTALVVRRNKHIAISGNCKTMRGAKKKGTMTSSYLTGVFKTESALRAEFLNFVNNK